jgi:hypothetical protein
MRASILGGLLLLALFSACDATTAPSGGHGSLSSTTADIGVYPPSAVILKASVEPVSFRRFLPIGLVMSVTNATSNSISLPLLLPGADFVRISLELPSGKVVRPSCQGGESRGGKLRRDLAPGESMTAAVTLDMGPTGDFLFREVGTYLVKVSYRALAVSFSLEVLANALSPASAAYVGYARYALGLAHARAGSLPCGGINVLPKNVIDGEAYLVSSLVDLPTSYLRKRAAYWLTRCAKTKGDVAAYARYRTLYSSISHPFPTSEEGFIN